MDRRTLAPYFTISPFTRNSLLRTTRWPFRLQPVLWGINNNKEIYRRACSRQGEKQFSVHSPSENRVLRILTQGRGKALSTVHVFVLPAPAAGISCIWCKPQGNSEVSRAGIAHPSTDECVVTASCVDTLMKKEPDPMMIGENVASWYVMAISGSPSEQPIHA